MNLNNKNINAFKCELFLESKIEGNIESKIGAVFFLCFVILGFLPNQARAESISWRADKSCVAWQARKTLLLVSSSEPVGMNCNVQVSSSLSKTGRIVRALVPIKDFDSGETERDVDVQKILKAETQPNLEIETLPIPTGAWEKILKEKSGMIKLNLKMAGQDFSFETFVTIDGQPGHRSASGTIATTFTEFMLKRPKLAGGLVSNVKDDLRLHFQFVEMDWAIPTTK